MLPFETRRETDLMYTGRALVSCSLPLKPVKVTILEKSGKKVQKFASKFVRDSGAYRIKILADEAYGIPFGKDRLFLYWLISQAVKHSQRIVYYSSVRKLLESLQLPYGQPNRLWIRGAIDRILNSTLFFEYNNGLIHGTEKDTILSRVVGVLDPKLADEPYTECYFELSQDFFNELVTNKHAIPFDMEVIAHLAGNYGAMDFYVWWNYKLYTERNSKEPYYYIPLDNLRDQFGSPDMPLFRFKQLMKTRLKLLNRAITLVYGINSDIGFSGDKVSFKLIQPLLRLPEKPKPSSPEPQKAEPEVKPNPVGQALLAEMNPFQNMEKKAPQFDPNAATTADSHWQKKIREMQERFQNAERERELST